MMEEATRATGIWRDRLARLQKLRTMSARELTARAGYGMLTAWERSGHQPGRLTALRRLDLSGRGMPRHSASWREWLLARRRERRAAFLPSVENKAPMQELFRARYARELDVSKEKAEQTRNHVFEFFGQRFEYGSQIDWHADPESGRRWPLVYHRDVPIHDAAGPFGDAKYVWELNRQQFLIDLGKMCFLEDSETDAADAVSLVRSWILQNPPGVGVNWTCALEPAFRSLSWLWTYHLCLDSKGLDDDSHLAWLAGLHEHGRFLYRHLERYSSPYNHLIGEAAALYALGVLFPEFRRARAWRRRGRHVLESRLAEQFYRDGGSVEQSTFYHHATLGFYIFAALIGRANGEEFSDRIWQTIERAIEFSMYLTQPDGSTPSIGGADDGKPIRMEHRPLWDFRAFQALGAVLFDRQDMKYVAGDFPEDALWLLGPSGRVRFDALPSVPPADTCHALAASGYFVARNAWQPDGDYLLFDCGEQADSVRRDSVPNAVHGHADCLSAIVWLGGRPVLVDPGMYRYNGDPQWVSHFRRTGAHSTLKVDGQDQARYHGKMSWSNAFHADLEAWHPGPRQASVMGHHDGYLRRSDGVVHRRVAWMRPGGYVIIWDEIVGEGKHDLELRYQFARGSADIFDENCLLFNGFAEVGWASSVDATAECRCGGVRPGDGWVATGLGVRLAAPVLTLAARFQAPRVMFVAVLADRRVTGGTPRLAVVRQHPRGLAVSVRSQHSVDWIVSGDMEGTLPFETDAKLAVWGITEGRVIEASRIGGRYMQLSGADDRIALPDNWPCGGNSRAVGVSA
jgi:Heparinase II/III N-terminus/Heparinase II/III-like protein